MHHICSTKLEEFSSKAIKSSQGESAHTYSSTELQPRLKKSDLLLSLENMKLLARQKEAQRGFPRRHLSSAISAKLPSCLWCIRRCSVSQKIRSCHAYTLTPVRVGRRNMPSKSWKSSIFSHFTETSLLGRKREPVQKEIQNIPAVHIFRNMYTRGKQSLLVAVAKR